MTDAIGALSLPVPVTETAGDPALGMLAEFCAAVLNSDAQTAWSAVYPRPDDEALAPVVRNVFTTDPTLGGWVAEQVPALFVWRVSGRQQDATFGFRTEQVTFRLVWIFPPDDVIEHLARATFPRALMAALGAAIYQQRHPAWTAEADAPGVEGADPKAPSLPADTDAVALAGPTQTSPLTLSGASLDGVSGGDTLLPRRGVSVTTTAATGAYSTAAPIVVTYLDWQGNEQTGTIALTSANGGETVNGTLEASAIVSVAIPAQALTTGSISVGLMARAGRGSQLLDRAGFTRLSLDEWQPTTVNIEVYDDAADQRVSRVIRYQAAQATLTATERHTVDPSVHASPLPTAPAGLDLDVVIDGYVATRAELDGAEADPEDAPGPA